MYKYTKSGFQVFVEAEIVDLNKRIISKQNELKSIEHEVRMKKLELEKAQKTQISTDTRKEIEKLLTILKEK
ncbi:Uncharacterised protein [Chryseobacterium nakagawai]|uniref:Uncharacterized protein n=1 Tax=Chryseobacterium nakagawai TaxID=1241982 RepID=A0AAD0YLR5_CHRNA|nr:hypothetical protein [Chryseobacterium nakagawai]AZA91137.1 hypothetical protein EG343_11100 [Chryseobacterium nakagawai]VEH22697.1 Uncharacterised protein [Chryseobacterium nakagawai]